MSFANGPSLPMSLPEPGSDAWRAQVETLRTSLLQLPDPLPIPMVAEAFRARVRPPGSKSLTNRALLLAALATGESELSGALVEADDARVMIEALRSLGAEVFVQSAPSGGDVTVRVRGVGGRWCVGPEPVSINLNNAGTATRFLTAAAVLAPAESGGIIIDGNARMRERPIAELGDALRLLGVRLSYAEREGFPPLQVVPPRGGEELAREVEFGSTASSQFISALLLIAPFVATGLTVISREPLTSPSYIEMTIALMERVGVRVRCRTPREGETLRVEIEPQRVAAFKIAIEPDASGATYFEAAAALVPGACCDILGLDVGPSPGRTSLQGDTQFVGVIAAMGARVERVAGGLRVTGADTLHAADIDLADMPDTAMTAAVLACFAEPTHAHPTATTTLHGLRTLRVKETDRLAALQRELSKIGARVEVVPEIWHGVSDEALRITPAAPATAPYTPIVFETYDDHRMGMALALIGLRRAGVFIQDPGCVRKTYPNYFQDLANLYA